MNTNTPSFLRLKRKMGLREMPLWGILLAALFLVAGCSISSAQAEIQEKPDRFAAAKQNGQFIPVNRSIDCKGTKVTLEKILLDKTHTFMLAAVDGPVKGNMDSLTVDLFDDQDRDLGRSTFAEILPDGKTLLTFDALAEIPAALRLEFFGGPVGYDGKVSLTLNDLPLTGVEEKYISEYLYPATLEKKGYRLEINGLEKGISETGLQYQLTALGDYDGIEHGWLSESWHQSSSQILFLSAGGQNLAPHLANPYNTFPAYRRSRDGKAAAGRAYFDRLTADTLQIKLTDLYGVYNLSETIPLNGINNALAINRSLPVRNYSVELKSFSRGRDGRTWTLCYRVLDAAGQPVDGAIDAGIYQKLGNYQMPYPV
jgi:hypothetical protein